METSRALLVELQKTLVDQYAAQLARLPMKKSVRETLVDGFQDGAREGIKHAVAMLGVTVTE